MLSYSSACHLFKLEREWSDHAPLMVVFYRRNSSVGSGSKPFRFEQLYANADECEEVVTKQRLFG